MTLYFFKADGCCKEKLFKIVLDYSSWMLKSTEIYSNDDDYPKIIHEFMLELNDDIKDAIIGGKEAVLSGFTDCLREDIDYNELSLGLKIFYSEIYDAGVYGQLVFENENTQYFIMDHYCIDPKV